MENNLKLKTINELRSLKFYIPSYQRGYRWKEYEVVDLLNDINEFKPRQVDETDDKTWYCLQPIVVKAVDNDKFDQTLDKYSKDIKKYKLIESIIVEKKNSFKYE